MCLNAFMVFLFRQNLIFSKNLASYIVALVNKLEPGLTLLKFVNRSLAPASLIAILSIKERQG